MKKPKANVQITGSPVPDTITVHAAVAVPIRDLPMTEELAKAYAAEVAAGVIRTLMNYEGTTP